MAELLDPTTDDVRSIIGLPLTPADNTLLIYDTTTMTWESKTGVISEITGLGIQSQILNMNTHKITGVVDPTLAQDVATKNYVDTTTFSDALTNSYVFVGSVDNIAVGVALSGSVIINNIGRTQLADNSVDTAQLVAESVGTSEIQTLSIVNFKMASDVVDNRVLADSAVGTSNISDDVVTYAKIQNMTTDRILGRVTASSGIIEELTGTQATTILDNFTSLLKGLVPLSGGGTVNYLRADGTWATPPTGGTIPPLTNNQIYVGSATNVPVSVALSGDATIINTGAITIAAGAITTTKIIDNAVTTAKIENASVTLNKIESILGSSILGNILTGSSSPQVITGTQVTTLLSQFSSALKGVVPGSGGGIINYLRADGTWAAPSIPALTNGSIFVGNATNVPTSVVMSGDITITNTGITSIGDTKITSTQISNGAISTDKIGLQAVTFIKMQTIPTKTIMGNVSATTNYFDPLTGAEATSILDNFTSLLKGLVPLSGGGTVNYLRADGTWAAPSIPALANGSIFVGNASAVPTAVAMSGDATIINTGALTLANNAVTTVKITDANVTAAKLATNSITNIKISDDAVTYAKIQNMTTARILGRVTAASGVVEELTAIQATAFLNNFSSTLKGLVPLSAGGTANYLRADGTWAAPAGGSTPTLDDGEIFVGNASNVPTGVEMSGDITITNAGVTTIGAGKIIGSMILDNTITGDRLRNYSIQTSKFTRIAATSMFGNITNSLSDVNVISGTQVTTILDNFTSTLKGLTPLSGGGTVNYLRADGTWAAPSGGGGGGTKVLRIPIQVKAVALVPAYAGNSFYTANELTAYTSGNYEFLKNVNGYIVGSVRVPEELATSPAAKIVISYMANATSGITRLFASTGAIADGESMNPATLTQETGVNSTVPTTAYLRKDVTIALTNQPTANDMMIVNFQHDGANVADTLDANTILIGAYLEITVNA